MHVVTWYYERRCAARTPARKKLSGGDSSECRPGRHAIHGRDSMAVPSVFDGITPSVGDELSDDHPVRPRTNTDVRALDLPGNPQDAAP
jgi:hypothetical protein